MYFYICFNFCFDLTQPLIYSELQPYGLSTYKKLGNIAVALAKCLQLHSARFIIKLYQDKTTPALNEEFDDDQSRGQTRNLKSGIITWQSVQNFWSNYCLSASGILELKLSTCYKIYFLFKLQICKFGAF